MPDLWLSNRDLRVTRHQDGTTSLRLRRHGSGGDEPSLEMVLHGLEMAALGFESNGHRAQQGLSNIDRKEDAPAYFRLAQQYRALARHIQKESDR